MGVLQKDQRAVIQCISSIARFLRHLRYLWPPRSASISIVLINKNFFFLRNEKVHVDPFSLKLMVGEPPASC